MEQPAGGGDSQQDTSAGQMLDFPHKHTLTSMQSEFFLYNNKMMQTLWMEGFCACMCVFASVFTHACIHISVCTFLLKEKQ